MLTQLSVVEIAETIVGADRAFVERVRALDDACRGRGIFLTFQTDMRLFREVFLHLNDPRAHLSPLLDASIADLSEARWILGKNEAGEVVTTQAFRFYPDDGSTSYDRWLSLRMFYDRPEQDAPPDESCVLTGEAVDVNRRLRCWLASGGTWVHADHRGPDLGGVHLSELLPRLSRTLGMRMYGAAQATTSGIRPKLATAGIAERYGYKRIAPLLVHTREQKSADFLFLTMPRDEMESDARDFHARLTAGRAVRAAG